jgi:phosphoglycerol geranylgeranyltransferase
VILFPGNVTGVSPNADAILFMSLLNSENPYFITGAQALGAIGVKKSKLEALPTGYLIIGEGTSVSWNAIPIFRSWFWSKSTYKSRNGQIGT